MTNVTEACFLLVVLAVTFSSAHILFTGTGNDDENIIRSVLPCVLNISHSFPNRTDYIFLVEELDRIKDYDGPIAALLQNMLGPVLLIREEVAYSPFSSLFLLFPKDDGTYENLFNSINLSVDNYFVLVWLQDDFGEAEFAHIANQFWRFKILNVIILVKNFPNNTVDVYTYIPYGGDGNVNVDTWDHCDGPGSAILVDKWLMEEKHFERGTALFFAEKKLGDFRGCPLTCLAKSRPPDSIIYQMDNGTWFLGGTGGELFEIIRKKLNFTPVITMPHMKLPADRYGYDISDGIPQLVSSELHNGSVDVAFGIYSYIIYENPLTVFSLAGVNECFGWAVPNHSGENPSVWKYYVREFSPTVWLAVSAQFALCAALSYVLFGSSRRIDSVVLYLYSVTLGFSASSPFVKDRRLTARLFLGSFILYSLIVSAAYQSSLGSFLTVPWKREQIKTHEEIIERNFTVTGIPQAGRILSKFSSDNTALKVLSDRYIFSTEAFDNILFRIQKERDTATFGAKRFVEFYTKETLGRAGSDDVYLMPGCVLQAFSSPFLFKKGSPLKKVVDRIVHLTHKAGLSNMWYSLSTPRLNRVLEMTHPFSVNQMVCAIVFLIAGNLIATIAFIFELLYPPKSNTTSIPTKF